MFREVLGRPPPSFAPALARLVERIGGRVTLLDIGSRNGIGVFAHLAEHTHAYGFEPNPEEYRRLVSRTTDFDKLAGKPRSPYAKLSYFPTAVAGHSGEATLHVTRSPSASSLYAPNASLLDRFDIARKFDVVEKEKVRVDTLQNVCRENRLARIDLLKMDAQGAERDILRGSLPYVRQSVGVIKTEVCFNQMYLGQGLFADIDLTLREAGFELLDIEIDDVHRRAKVDSKSPRRQLLWGDAIYARMSHAVAESALASALVLVELGFRDDALWIAREHGVDGPDLHVVTEWYRRRADSRLREQRDRILRSVSPRVGTFLRRIARR